MLTSLKCGANIAGPAKPVVPPLPVIGVLCLIPSKLATIIITYSDLNSCQAIKLLFLCAANHRLGKVEPSIIVVYSKDKVKIYCYSKTDVVWMKDSTILSCSPNVKTYWSARSYQSYLVLNNVKVEQSGIYTCLGTLRNGKTFAANSFLYVGGKTRLTLILFLCYIIYD